MNNIKNEKVDPRNAISRAMTTLEMEKGESFARDLNTKMTTAIA
jgi:hypothetical protein